MTREAEILSANSPEPAAEEQILELARTYHKPSPPRKGHNIYTVAVNYEHFVAIQERLGLFPESLARRGMFYDIYYGADGQLRFDREIPRKTIGDLLLSLGFDLDDATAIEEFLLPMLRWIQPNAQPLPRCGKGAGLGISDRQRSERDLKPVHYIA
jgi:hypothetical protein